MASPDPANTQRVVVGAVGLTLIASVVASFVAGQPGWAFGFAVLLVGFAALAVLDFASMRLGGQGFGFEATKAEKAAAQVEAALSEADVDELAPPAESAPAAPGNDEPPKKLDLTTLLEGAKEREQRRRKAIERVMTEAAEWGFTLAKSGYPSPVRVKVDWDSGPAPRLLFDEHPPPSSFWRARTPVTGELPRDPKHMAALQVALERAVRERKENP